MEPAMFRSAPLILLVGSLAISPVPAQAHAVLQTTDARQNSVYKAVIAIDHGCNGAATTAIHVTIPEGFVAAKPMPKPGWTLTIGKGPYARAYPFKGSSIAEGAKTITWEGNLPADNYDEFVVSGFITDGVPAGTTLYFPVVQDCGTMAYRWIETPSSTTETAQLAHPAPGVRIMAAIAAPNTVAIIDHLRVSQPWARATPVGASTAEAYLTVENRGPSADRLTGVTSDIAASVTISDARSEGEAGTARPIVTGLQIAPGERLELRPGAYHLTLNGLKQPLAEGAAFKATLTFDKAGSLPIEFHVANNDALTSGGIMPVEDAPDRL